MRTFLLAAVAALLLASPASAGWRAANTTARPDTTHGLADSTRTWAPPSGARTYPDSPAPDRAPTPLLITSPPTHSSPGTLLAGFLLLGVGVLEAVDAGKADQANLALPASQRVSTARAWGEALGTAIAGVALLTVEF